MATSGAAGAALSSGRRVVGAARGLNPIPIIIPCHRVISASGKLGGYSGNGGLDTKRALLNLKAAHLELTAG